MIVAGAELARPVVASVRSLVVIDKRTAIIN
jgi:hypothetical protein